EVPIRTAAGRHEGCVNKYSAIKPGPGAKYTLQREPRGHGAGNVSARKNARMDSVPSEDPQIESPYDRCNSGRIGAGVDNPRRLGCPIRELRVTQEQPQQIDDKQSLRLTRLSIHVEHGHAEGRQAVDKNVAKLKRRR